MKEGRECNAMTEPENAGEDLSKEEKFRNLALMLNHELGRALEELNKALRETDSMAGLRPRVRSVCASLNATIHAFAKAIEEQEGEEGEQDHA
jgi:hypothetical protein